MGRDIFEDAGVQARIFAGPMRSDDQTRRRVCITDDRGGMVNLHLPVALALSRALIKGSRPASIPFDKLLPGSHDTPPDGRCVGCGEPATDYRFGVCFDCGSLPITGVPNENERRR